MHREQTCCFTGHRKISARDEGYINKKLETEIEKLISTGVRYFGVGGALGFDTIAALKILEMRKIYPHIKLILVFPCKNQTERWKTEDIEIYNQIKEQCDKYVYVSENYDSSCMFKRNRHLVDNSKYCIAYCNKTSGGTYYTLNYAKQKGLTVINIS